MKAPNLLKSETELSLAKSIMQSKTSTETLWPPSSEKPKNTISYNSTLCKTHSGIHVFDYVADDAKFNERFETTPVKAMLYNKAKNLWESINPKSVICYDPLEGIL